MFSHVGAECDFVSRATGPISQVLTLKIEEEIEEENRSLLGSTTKARTHMLPFALQAIEGFALMVKKTAQMLQSFGTELAETELPNEIQATTILLSTHTDKKNKMKVNEVH